MSAPKPYKTEIELIDACKHGNRSAQRHLYDKYAARMYAVCLKYARSAEVAKDYLQEGFVTVFTKIGSYAGEGSFEGWMRRIFVNVALMDLRRNDVLGDARDVMELRSEAPRVDDVSAKLEHKDLLRLIMEMPLGFRTVFNLSIVEGYSHQEISQKLGISEGASRSQLSRARSWLQQRMQNL